MCGDCTAFSPTPKCQNGDVSVHTYSTCYTCPYQWVCGKCVDPCDVQATSVDVIPQSYPVNADTTSASSEQITSTTTAINKGANAQTVTVTFTFTYQVTTTATFAKAFAFSEKATAKVGVPFIGDTGLEFSSTQTLTTTDATMTQQTATYTGAISQQIPAYTQQNVTATGHLGTVMAKVGRH